MPGGLRLGIDAVGALHGGAAEIALGIVEAAIREARVEEVVVFSSPRPLRRFEFPPSRRIRVVEVERSGGGWQRVAWLCRGLSRASRENGLTRLLCLSGAGVASGEVRVTLLVQQSLPFISDAVGAMGWQSRARYGALGALMRLSAARAHRVVVQTETMRALVSARWDIPQGRLSVIPVGLRESRLEEVDGARGGRSADSQGPRLLYVGNGERYKRLDLIPEVLDLLARQGVAASAIATIAPGEGLESRHDVKLVGYLSRADVRAEMLRATCVVMPSLAETICLPLVEAMALSVPVVAADRPYAREVCGEAGTYFNPGSAEDFAAAIMSVWKERELVGARLAAGHIQAARFAGAEAFQALVAASIAQEGP